ncbi:putative zinc finger protein CONSTANS-LIKE 11 isoform X2 [Durio zibethinus]|uniref:Zinc finger protein CONSTANS-LIKE 11 isoform X2 n=1 Tax=Durio zibethinus TaxID=66656 RepID=A0A6P5WZW9_DURZI|nr:putative zinc finger protein CONSTANS-LIKE 11 isoform X2 [Durio zibethinus]
MKKCELCNSLAKVYCESDQANLCWDCDSRVHGANFLVAKHLRTLLCRLCQSPTPWNGSGPKLGPTLSVCDSCVNRNACREEINNEEETRDDNNEDDLGGEDDSSEDDDDDSGGDEENRVVPWSSTPPVSSSSTSEESSTRLDSTQEGASQSRTVLSLNRTLDTVEPASRDHSGCSFSPQHQSKNLSNESTSLDAFMSLKDQKITMRDPLKGF